MGARSMFRILARSRPKCSMHFRLAAIQESRIPSRYADKLSVRTSFWRPIMKDQELAMKSADELWALYEKIRVILPRKLDAEKHQLERRLVKLTGRVEKEAKARRPYPKVQPKYHNPERPSETWSGRGKQPHWVGAQLKSGTKVDELLIAQTH